MAAVGQTDEVYGSLTLYRELAYFITRREEYERALKYFNQAIEKNPTDKRCLIGRSWTRAKACEYAGALQDIANALKQDPEDLIALAYRALNTYLSCEFEDALVMNTRLVPKRKKPDHFTMGVMTCTEAIENCLGARAGHPLRDHFKIIRKLAWMRNHEAEKPFEPTPRSKKMKKWRKGAQKKAIKEPVIPHIRTRAAMNKMHNKDGLSTVADQELDILDSLHSFKTESLIIPPGKAFPFKPLQNYTTNIENYMAEKYLDSMYLDKIFLRCLTDHPGLLSPNKNGVNRLKHLCKEGYKTISYKQELLRTRRPFYYIKYQEAHLSDAMRGRMNIELKKMQLYAKKEADTLLVKIKRSIERRQTRHALDRAEKLKIFCELKPKKILPMREYYLINIYHLVSLAYYQVFRSNPSHSAFQEKRRVKWWFGIPLTRDPSQDSVINQFTGVFIDYQKQISVYEERLRKATNSEEMAWMYHELAIYQTAVKQYELARVYCRKCIQEAAKIQNIHWTINAMMQIARTNMLQNNKNDTKSQLHETLKVATAIGDSTLETFIKVCLEFVEEYESSDYVGAKVLEKREQQILQIMASLGSEMKSDTAFLFRKMGAMPTTRRMSVMPGVRLEDPNEKLTASLRKRSIMPASKPEEIPGAPFRKGEKKDEGEKSDRPKGTGFMELIKFHVE